MRGLRKDGTFQAGVVHYTGRTCEKEAVSPHEAVFAPRSDSHREAVLSREAIPTAKRFCTAKGRSRSGFCTAKRCQIPAGGCVATPGKCSPFFIAPRRGARIRIVAPPFWHPFGVQILGIRSIPRVRSQSLATLGWDLAPLRGAKIDDRGVSRLRGWDLAPLRGVKSIAAPHRCPNAITPPAGARRMARLLGLANLFELFLERFTFGGVGRHLVKELCEQGFGTAILIVAPKFLDAVANCAGKMLGVHDMQL